MAKTLNWMIGPENLGACLGLGTDKAQTQFSVGVFVPHKDLLKGQNRDKKFSAGGPFRRTHVTWIVEPAPLARKFYREAAG